MSDAGNAGNPVLPQVNFARAPGQADLGAILDYTMEAAKKQYKNATLPLVNKHDLSASNLRDFLQLLAQRADVYDWSTILEFEKGDGTTISLLKQYGNITLNAIKQEAEVYEGNNNCASQDSQQLADCIINSLTLEARSTITLYEDEYMVNGLKSGPCMLKVVIRESHIDTNATTRIIQEELNKLDTYMVSIDSNIIKFNEHVQDLIKQLHARGETTQDLLANLFRAYKVVPDKDFVTYINAKRDNHDDGTEVIEPNKLMLLAGLKYKTKKQEGKWNAPSTEEEELLTLHAEVKKLKISKANKNDFPSKDKVKRQCKRGHRSQTKGQEAMQALMDAPSKQGDKHMKTVNNKEWHWCPKHECWVRHSPTECKGKGFVSATSGKNADT